MTPAGMVLRSAAVALADAGIDAPAREARILLAHALGRASTTLLNPTELIDPAIFNALLVRRCAREPMALILGSQGFWTLDLAVSGETLIPRADSEALIEAALAARADRGAVRRVLDLGTGTGCLLLAALVEFPAAFGIGVDCNPAAAALASANAARNDLAGRAAFLAGDWAAGLDGRFDLILSNPPYITTADMVDLMPEIRSHEPVTALDGGVDGLDCYRAILAAVPGLLAPDGVAVLERGAGQGADVSALAVSAGLQVLAMRADLGGIARALIVAASRD